MQYLINYSNYEKMNDLYTDAPVFIVASIPSDITLLHLMLDAHPKFRISVNAISCLTS